MGSIGISNTALVDSPCHQEEMARCRPSSTSIERHASGAKPRLLLLSGTQPASIGRFAPEVVIRTFYESTLVQRQVLDGCLCDRTHCGRDLLPVRWSVAEADRGCESCRSALLLTCLRQAGSGRRTWAIRSSIGPSSPRPGVRPNARPARRSRSSPRRRPPTPRVLRDPKSGRGR
jgi:hypothetical protein